MRGRDLLTRQERELLERLELGPITMGMDSTVFGAMATGLLDRHLAEFDGETLIWSISDQGVEVLRSAPPTIESTIAKIDSRCDRLEALCLRFEALLKTVDKPSDAVPLHVQTCAKCGYPLSVHWENAGVPLTCPGAESVWES